MAPLLKSEHRPWTGVLGLEALRIPGSNYHVQLAHQFAHRRSTIAGCLRPSRPFQTSPISEPKPELLTPSAALVEAETRVEVCTNDQQIAYLKNLVARLSQHATFTDKVSEINSIVREFYMASTVKNSIDPRIGS